MGYASRAARWAAAASSSHGDHRIAMAFAVASLAARDTIEIDDVANVSDLIPGISGTGSGCGPGFLRRAHERGAPVERARGDHRWPQRFGQGHGQSFAGGCAAAGICSTAVALYPLVSGLAGSLVGGWKLGCGPQCAQSPAPMRASEISSTPQMGEERVLLDGARSQACCAPKWPCRRIARSRPGAAVRDCPARTSIACLVTTPV